MAPNAEVELELTFLDVVFADVVVDAKTAALDKKIYCRCNYQENRSKSKKNYTLINPTHTPEEDQIDEVEKSSIMLD